MIFYIPLVDALRPSGRRRQHRPVPREDREPGFAVAECSEVPFVPKNVVLYCLPVAALRGRSPISVVVVVVPSST